MPDQARRITKKIGKEYLKKLIKTTMPAGRPTELDDELFCEIRSWILEGKTLKEISQLSGIPTATMDTWKSKNYKGFADKIYRYKLEWRLAKAEEFSDYLLQKDDEKDEMLRLKQKESEFLRKTLGKKHYSERTELTAADGQPFINPQIKYEVPKGNNDNPETDTQTAPSVPSTVEQED